MQLIFYSLLFSILLIIFFTRVKLNKIFYDVPNQRSSHTKPTLKIGGVIIFSIFFPTIYNEYYSFSINLLLPAFIIFIISFLDDLFHVSNLIRFLFHLFASIIFISLLPIDNIFISMFFVISMIWITNLYNFMDGIDGLSVSMTIVGFSSFAYIFYLKSAYDLSVISSLLVFVVLPFFYFNFIKSKIFIGDSGATTIGFLAGALGLIGWTNELFPIWFPILIFVPFGADATLTLILRLYERKNPFQPHNEFFFHKLIFLGYPKNIVLYLYLFFMILSSLLAFFIIKCSIEVIYFSFYLYLILLLCILVYIHVKWKKI